MLGGFGFRSYNLWGKNEIDELLEKNPGMELSELLDHETIIGEFSSPTPKMC